MVNMTRPISVGVIGATGNTGRTVANGLLSSSIDFAVTSFTRASSVDSQPNQELKAKGVKIGIDVLISCIAWEHLEQQIPWIEASKKSGVRRFVPSEWVGPTPKGVVDIKDKKLDILGVIYRAGLPYTIIDVGCWYQVFVPRVPSGRPDHAASQYIDHRIVNDGNQRFALTDMADIGKYVAQIISDSRTLNRHVFAYTEVMSMNEIWDFMAKVSGEEPSKEYVTEVELHEIIDTCRKRLQASVAEPELRPRNTMDVANFNMRQNRISWCIRGDNTPEYADYLGHLDYWKLFPDFPRGKSLETFYTEVIDGQTLNKI